MVDLLNLLTQKVVLILAGAFSSCPILKEMGVTFSK